MAEKTGNCKHKLYIECFDQRNCNKCGWNPEVEERRKKKLAKMSKKESGKWIVGEKKDYKKMWEKSENEKG